MEKLGSVPTGSVEADASNANAKNSAMDTKTLVCIRLCLVKYASSKEIPHSGTDKVDDFVVTLTARLVR